ncbi:MAG: hypothetical protein WCR95_01575 [Eubacteriales bacterium]
MSETEKTNSLTVPEGNGLVTETLKRLGSSALFLAGTVLYGVDFLLSLILLLADSEFDPTMLIFQAPSVIIFIGLLHFFISARKKSLGGQSSLSPRGLKAIKTTLIVLACILGLVFIYFIIEFFNAVGTGSLTAYFDEIGAGSLLEEYNFTEDFIIKVFGAAMFILGAIVAVYFVFALISLSRLIKAVSGRSAKKIPVLMAVILLIIAAFLLIMVFTADEFSVTALLTSIPAVLSNALFMIMIFKYNSEMSLLWFAGAGKAQ